MSSDWNVLRVYPDHVHGFTRSSIQTIHGTSDSISPYSRADIARHGEISDTNPCGFNSVSWIQGSRFHGLKPKMLQWIQKLDGIKTDIERERINVHNRLVMPNDISSTCSFHQPIFVAVISMESGRLEMAFFCPF